MKALKVPFIYRLSQGVAGARKARRVFVSEYARPGPNDRILDIGCGTADILKFLPNSVEYVGFDINPKYVDSAKRRFGKRGIFLCNRISKDAIPNRSAFDTVLACSVIHHLNDNQAEELLELARSVMKSGAKLITLDGCYVDGQSAFGRFLLSKDRGRYVRTREDYLKLASKVFNDVKTYIRQDLLMFPYTHIIMECAK